MTLLSLSKAAIALMVPCLIQCHSFSDPHSQRGESATWCESCVLSSLECLLPELHKPLDPSKLVHWAKSQTSFSVGKMNIISLKSTTEMRNKVCLF